MSREIPSCRYVTEMPWYAVRCWLVNIVAESALGGDDNDVKHHLIDHLRLHPVTSTTPTHPHAPPYGRAKEEWGKMVLDGPEVVVIEEVTVRQWWNSQLVGSSPVFYLRPQRPHGLLGTWSPGRPPRLTHSS